LSLSDVRLGVQLYRLSTALRLAPYS